MDADELEAQMLADLGFARRDIIATADEDDGFGRARRRRQIPLVPTASYDPGRERLESKYGEERALYLAERAKNNPASTQRNGSLITNEFPTSNQPASDPRGSGTVWFHRDQQIATRPAALGGGSILINRPGTAPRAILTHPVQGRSIRPQSSISNANRISKPRQSRSKTSSAQSQGSSLNKLTAQSLQALINEPPPLLTKAKFDGLRPAGMTGTKWEELKTHLFSASRQQWLESNSEWIAQFDAVGITLRETILRVASLPANHPDLMQFTKEFVSLPSFNAHLSAARMAVKNAEDNDPELDAYFERNSQYVPFLQLARRNHMLRKLSGSKNMQNIYASSHIRSIDQASDSGITTRSSQLASTSDQVNGTVLQQLDPSKSDTSVKDNAKSVKSVHSISSTGKDEGDVFAKDRMENDKKRIASKDAVKTQNWPVASPSRVARVIEECRDKVIFSEEQISIEASEDAAEVQSENVDVEPDAASHQNDGRQFETSVDSSSATLSKEHVQTDMPNGEEEQIADVQSEQAHDSVNTGHQQIEPNLDPDSANDDSTFASTSSSEHLHTSPLRGRSRTGCLDEDDTVIVIEPTQEDADRLALIEANALRMISRPEMMISGVVLRDGIYRLQK